MLTAIPKRLLRQVVAAQGSLTAGRPSTSEAGRTPLMPRNHLPLDAKHLWSAAGTAALAALVSSSYLGVGAGGVGDRIYCGHHIYRRSIIPTMSLSSAGESSVKPPALQDAGANLSGPVPLLQSFNGRRHQGRESGGSRTHSTATSSPGVVVVWRSGGCLVQGGRAVPALGDIGGRGDKHRDGCSNLRGDQALPGCLRKQQLWDFPSACRSPCRCSCRRKEDGPTARLEWPPRNHSPAQSAVNPQFPKGICSTAQRLDESTLGTSAEDDQVGKLAASAFSPLPTIPPRQSPGFLGRHKFCRSLAAGLWRGSRGQGVRSAGWERSVGWWEFEGENHAADASASASLRRQLHRCWEQLSRRGNSSRQMDAQAGWNVPLWRRCEFLGPWMGAGEWGALDGSCLEA
jgi:hypothetical protein